MLKSLIIGMMAGLLCIFQEQYMNLSIMNLHPRLECFADHGQWAAPFECALFFGAGKTRELKKHQGTVL